MKFRVELALLVENSGRDDTSIVAEGLRGEISSRGRAGCQSLRAVQHFVYLPGAAVSLGLGEYAV